MAKFSKQQSHKNNTRFHQFFQNRQPMSKLSKEKNGPRHIGGSSDFAFFLLFKPRFGDLPAKMRSDLFDFFFHAWKRRRRHRSGHAPVRFVFWGVGALASSRKLSSARKNEFESEQSHGNAATDPVSPFRLPDEFSRKRRCSKQMGSLIMLTRNERLNGRANAPSFVFSFVRRWTTRLPARKSSFFFWIIFCWPPSIFFARVRLFHILIMKTPPKKNKCRESWWQCARRERVNGSRCLVLFAGWLRRHYTHAQTHTHTHTHTHAHTNTHKGHENWRLAPKLST